MISRLWHGWTSPVDADAYERLLRHEIFEGISGRGIPGFLGIDLLRRPRGELVEFVTIMWFDSLDAVRAFAGPDYEVAVVPPAARALLARFDERSAHYEVCERRSGTAPAPATVVRAWVEAFNRGDADALALLYAPDAVNHQVVWEPIAGRDAIRAMFAREFATAEMTCIVEQLLESGDWAILEWRDPGGLRGCGFFHVVDGLIRFQRGYWDRLAFLRQHGLPIPPG